jgi:phage terminase large subunit-like protein
LTPESEFRTKRCNQWVAASDTWLPHGAWDAIADADRVLDPGTSYVLGFDGSFNGDCTAIVAISCTEVPHIFPVAVWEKPEEADASWQVPVLEVEETLRQFAKANQVVEIACDPYRWARTFQVLEEEKLPIVTFPQTSSRMTPATTRLFEAVVNKQISHNGDPQLARHFGNASLKVDQRGSRLAKEKRGSSKRIDLAVASVMALERAYWWHSQGDALPQVFDPWTNNEKTEVPSVWFDYDND